jgi:regulator of protease activity HflC (stomatin/prohibitin superfamily)
VKSKLGKLLVLVAVLVLLPLVSGCFTAIPAGHRGVKVVWGDAQEALDPGAHWFSPFGVDVVHIDCQTQRVEQATEAASADLQTVQTTVTLNYSIDPQQVVEFYSEHGYDTEVDDTRRRRYVRTIIEPRIAEVLKSVTAQYKAEELVSKRAEVKEQVEDELRNRLEDYALIVSPNGINLTDFSFSAEYDAAIEKKQVAEQQAKEAEYRLQEAEVKAEQRLIEAEAEAAANQQIAASLTPDLVRVRVMEEWVQKWDGNLPTVAGGGGGNLIDLRSMLQSAPAE